MPLRLDLMRHGDALPAGTGADLARALSPIGRRDCARIAEEFERRGWRPDRILSSPLARARETAAILAGTAPGVEPAVLRRLAPDAEPAELLAELQALDLQGHVLLVGHQPLLGRLSALLTGGPEIGFPTAGLVRVAFDGGPGAGRGSIELRLKAEHLP